MTTVVLSGSDLSNLPITLIEGSEDIARIPVRAVCTLSIGDEPFVCSGDLTIGYPTGEGALLIPNGSVTSSSDLISTALAEFVSVTPEHAIGQPIVLMGESLSAGDGSTLTIQLLCDTVNA